MFCKSNEGFGNHWNYFGFVGVAFWGFCQAGFGVLSRRLGGGRVHFGAIFGGPNARATHKGQ